LPVQTPDKFVLAINLAVAKALGMTVPPTLVALLRRPPMSILRPLLGRVHVTISRTQNLQLSTSCRPITPSFRGRYPMDCEPENEYSTEIMHMSG
ncbi:MAG: hypothetical protein WBZ27_22175, partial [Pseudolabrys sp.]